MSSSTANAKHNAAIRALEFVRPGMRLGLGTGSTAALFVAALGEKVAQGLDVICVPTSLATQKQAQSLGIPLTTLDETPELDLTLDGADECDPARRLIKGGGGALLREKIVASASRQMVVLADESKMVATLGRFPLPVEVNIFGLGATHAQILRLASKLGLSGPIALRRGADGQPFVTDGGHYILDCSFGAIPDPETLGTSLNAIPGIVEHGLFIGLAGTIVIGHESGTRIF